MGHLLTYAVPGLPYGCVFALVAIGLSLTYKTSGVFNLAFGAQAYVSAVIFYVTVSEHRWPTAAGFLAAVLVAGPVLGIVFDRGLFRHMRTKPVAVKLISSLGLLVGIPPIVQFIFGSAPKVRPPSFAPNPDHVYRLGQYHLNGNQLATVVITLMAVVLLGLLFRFTALGLQMRAVVESPRMVELAGINADRVGGVAWMLSSLLAALAGVMLAPMIGANIDPNNFNTLLVAAIAASAIGGLSSIPLTLVGGLALGIGQELLAGYLPLNSVIATGIRPSFPFIVLVITLLVSPSLRRIPHAADPLGACDPPPPALTSISRPAVLDGFVRVGFPVFVVVFMAVALFGLSSHYLFLLTTGIIYSIVFLSITMLTGLSGQLSLCQATFAGVGAFTAAQLATHHGMSFLLAMLIGGAVAAAVGAVVALPALRLSGLYLALATLAFALMADNVIFPIHSIGGGITGIDVPRPQIGPVSFASTKSFFLLVMAVFAVCAFIVILVRKGTTGRFLAAMRGSEVAARTIGISPTRAKVMVFALSAGIAGIGGALFGSLNLHTEPNDFNYVYSLAFMVLVLTTGSRTVEGAVNAGMAFVILPEILSNFPARFGVLEFALFGYGAVNYAKHPEGIVEYQKRRSMAAVARLIEGRHAVRAAPTVDPNSGAAEASGAGSGGDPGSGDSGGPPATTAVAARSTGPA